MNNLGTVRLERLKIQNIKNVKNGEIFFPEQKKLERGEFDVDEFGSVLGIYGQNGSGKTTTVDALRILLAFDKDSIRTSQCCIFR